MGRAEADEVLGLLSTKVYPQASWPEYPDIADRKIQERFEDLWTDLWMYDLDVGTAVLQDLEKRRAPFLRYRTPIRPRKRIKRIRQRHPGYAEYLEQLLRVCDGIEERMALVERLRKAQRK